MKLNVAILIIFSCVLKFGLFTTTSEREKQFLDFINNIRRDFAVNKSIANMHKLEWNETIIDQEESRKWKNLFQTYRKSLFEGADNDSKIFTTNRSSVFSSHADAEVKRLSHRNQMFHFELILPAQKWVSCKRQYTSFENYSFEMICILGPEVTFDSYNTGSGPAGSRCPKGYFNDNGLCARKKEVRTTPKTTRIQKMTTTKKITIRVTPTVRIQKTSPRTTLATKKVRMTTIRKPTIVRIPKTLAPTTVATTTEASTTTVTTTIQMTSTTTTEVPTTTPEFQATSSTTSSTSSTANPTTFSTPSTSSTTSLSSLTTSERSVSKVHRPVVVVDKEAILHEFNEHRRKFAKERRISRMFQLTWDDSLAQLAQTGSPSNHRLYYDNPDLEGVKILNSLFQKYQGKEKEKNLKKDSKNAFLGYHEFLLPGQKRIGCAARHVTLEKGNFHSVCFLAPELNFDGYDSKIGDPGSDCPDGYFNDDGLCSSGKEPLKTVKTKKSENLGTTSERRDNSEELESLENLSTDLLNDGFMILFVIFIFSIFRN